MLGNKMCIFAYVSGKIQDWNCPCKCKLVLSCKGKENSLDSLLKGNAWRQTH